MKKEIERLEKIREEAERNNDLMKAAQVSMRIIELKKGLN